MKKLVEKYCELPQGIRKPMWRLWHKLLIDFDKDKSNLFMNYGYASSNGEFDTLKLSLEDEPYRYFIQLYDHVTKAHNFENSRVLEIGSGRGGGASFLTRYKKPAEYIAVDISQNIIDFCNKYHKVPGLRFVKGEAENIEFGEHEFDAVVNVESARCYGNISKFFAEVYRVLKPDGKFLFADMVKEKDLAGLVQKLKEAGFNIVKQTDIRENVVRALQHNSLNTKKEIDKKVPGFLKKSFYEFAGVEGSNRYYEFYNAQMNYYSFILTKK